MPSRRDRAFLLASILGSAIAAGGCGPRARPPVVHVERTAAPSARVSDEAFAGAVRDLLVTDVNSPERALRLAGVCGRQMSRASSRFRMRASDRGISAVVGGLSLFRARELREGTLGPDGDDALRATARELAARGDEGRARAIYEILSRTAPPADRADARGHLDALAAWTRDAVAKGGPLQSAGALQRVAVRRRLLEPSAEAQDDAVNATTEWIRRAIAVRTQARGMRLHPSGEETSEIYRGLSSGPAVLASLYLRDGDAAGALAALDRIEARELVSPKLVEALEGVVDAPASASWLEVLRQVRPLTAPDARDEDDRDVFRAAAFSIAGEAFRLDPTNPEAAGWLAGGLLDLGMAEASPAVAQEAVKAHPDAKTVGDALAVTMSAINAEVEAGDVEAARRAYRAALPILAIGDRRELMGRTRPTSARVRALMGEIELREGQLTEAKGLLSASIAVEKAGDVLFTLARLEWHQGQLDAAIEHLKAALSAGDTSRDRVQRGEILLTLSDVLREKGDAAGARAPLTSAARDLSQSQSLQDPEQRARGYRMFARVLDRFGDASAAQKAIESALDAAPRDKQQAALTLGLLTGRALVRGDLAGARDGLSRALAADLESEDLLYFALWVRLLERQLRQPSDGAPDRVFKAMADDKNGWLAKLAQYGAGRIKADELSPAAKSRGQQVEALFYAAMDRRAAGDVQGGDAGLKQVIVAGGPHLMEVSIARELLDAGRASLGPLPQDVRP